LNDPLANLKDIEGLDSISMWPLAIGWWVLLALHAVIIIAVALFYLRKMAFMRSWQGTITAQLLQMQKSLSKNNSQQIATELSEILRKVAIKRYSRAACAGLSGDKWLQFLSAHDKNNFDWVGRGKLLIDAPYAPNGKNITADSLTMLIDATKKWVR
jgi:hypothetical protein